MAYFFAVLESQLGLREYPGSSALDTNGVPPSVAEGSSPHPRARSAGWRQS
jgi:hypothetical protein